MNDGAIDIESPGRAQARPASGSNAVERSRSKMQAGDSGSGYASRARDLARSLGSNVGANPLTAVVGAVAVSAGLALLLPSTRRETAMMGEVADKLGDAARELADSAMDAGRDQVESLAQSALTGAGGAIAEALVSGQLLEGTQAKPG